MKQFANRYKINLIHVRSVNIYRVFLFVIYTIKTILLAMHLIATTNKKTKNREKKCILNIPDCDVNRNSETKLNTKQALLSFKLEKKRSNNYAIRSLSFDAKFSPGLFFYMHQIGKWGK